MSFDDRNANQIMEHEVCPNACRALWCAVIKENMQLVLRPAVADRPAERIAARRWFGSRDFHITCALAGLDGDVVLAGVQAQFAAAGIV